MNFKSKHIDEDFRKRVNFKTVKDNRFAGFETVWHVTQSKNIKSIFRNGFSREYTNSNVGNLYGPGVYSTFDLKSSMNNSGGAYGDYIIEVKIKDFNRFYIMDPQMAPKVYGEYKPLNQLKKLFGDKLHKIFTDNDIREMTTPGSMLNRLGFRRTGPCCYRLHYVIYDRRNENMLSDYNIRGMIFDGANDGRVAFITDFSAAIPYRYSTDGGRTWKDDLFNERLLNRTHNDADPIAFIGNCGHDISKLFNFHTACGFRVINNFMRVKRKDGKYNFLSFPDGKIVSETWLDSASDMDENGYALVLYNDNSFYLNGNGKFFEYDDPTVEVKDIKNWKPSKTDGDDGSDDNGQGGERDIIDDFWNF